MNILLCSISSPREITGIGRYNGELVRWFRERGHKVDVLTTLPYYPYWEIYEGYRDPRYKIEHSEQGTIYSVRLPVSKNVSTARRVMMDMTFGLKTLYRLPRLAYKNKYDIILLVLPPITGLPSAIAGKWMGKSKLHVHVQDLQLEAAGELNLLPSLLLKMLKYFEKFCFRWVDFASTISSTMVGRLQQEMAGSSVKVHLLENWVDTGSVKPVDNKSWLKKKYGYPADTFLIVYSGNIGEKQGLEQVLDTADMLSDNEKIQFLILGDGARREELTKKCNGTSPRNIRFGSLVPEKKLNRMLNGSDVQLVLQKEMTNDSFFPSKYISILAAGVPSVVTAKEGFALCEIATEYGTSVIAEPENPEALADAILRLYSSKELRSALSKNSRQLAIRRYGKDAILNSLLKEYKRIIR